MHYVRFMSQIGLFIGGVSSQLCTESHNTILGLQHASRLVRRTFVALLHIRG